MQTDKGNANTCFGRLKALGAGLILIAVGVLRMLGGVQVVTQFAFAMLLGCVGCSTGILRGTYKASQDGRTYLAVVDDNGGHLRTYQS
jgi:hypothetical protein